MIFYNYSQKVFFFFLIIYVQINPPQYETIAHNSKWYMLSVRQQKDLAIMLQRLQNGCTLSIGPFQELNFEVATKASDNIFFFFHFLYFE